MAKNTLKNYEKLIYCSKDYFSQNVLSYRCVKMAKTGSLGGCVEYTIASQTLAQYQNVVTSPRTLLSFAI